MDGEEDTKESALSERKEEMYTNDGGGFLLKT